MSDAAAPGHLRRVARGGALGLAGSAVSAVAGLALALLVTHAYDPHDAGLVFATIAVFTLLAVATGLGVDAGLVRFLLRLEAEGRRDAMVPTVAWALGPAVGAATVAAVVVGRGADDLAVLLGLGPDGAGLLRVAVVALPCCVLAEVCLAGTRAFGDVRPTVLVDKVGRSGAQTAVAALVVAGGGAPRVLVAAWATVYVASAVVAVLLLVRALRRRPRPAGGARHGTDGTRGLGRRFWGFTWPRGVAGLAQIGVQKVDVLLVAALLSPAHAAAYSVATRFVAVGQLANQAVHQVLQPRITAILVHDDLRTLRRVFATTTAWGILLVWPFYLAVGALAPAYLQLFGSAYAVGETVVVVVVLAGAMLLAVATGPVDTLLLMAGRSDLSMVNAVLALVVDVVLCLLLLPALGLVGAAVAWAVALATRCGLAVHQVRGVLGSSAVTPDAVTAGTVTVLALGAPLGLAAAAGGRPPAAIGGLLAGAVCFLLALRICRDRLHLDVLVAALRPEGRPAPSPPDHLRRDPTPMRARQLTRRIRLAAPPPVERGLRSAALVWGRLTADLRMTPDLLVVGAQRCGTTTLFRLLEAHPDLVRPTLTKGTGYFDDEHARGPRWYRAHFPVRVLARSARPGHRVRTFECSGYYLFHPLAAERIARELPGAQVVVLVRDPVERARSAHRHEVARGFEDLGFAEALAREPERTAGEAERIVREPGHRSFEHRHHAYLERGEYGAQVRRFVDALGAERVHVVDADRFFAEPVLEFVRLQRRLGLSPWVPPAVERWNARPAEPAGIDDHAALLRHFERSDRELGALMDRPPSWRAAQSTGART